MKNNKTIAHYSIIIQGFIETPFKIKENSLFIVNMSNPITLSLDLETLLKPPFDNSSAINTEIDRTREKLKDAISRSLSFAKSECQSMHICGHKLRAQVKQPSTKGQAKTRAKDSLAPVTK